MKDEIFSAISDFKGSYMGLNQITLYPQINNEQIARVRELFPQYQYQAETPLLFYKDADVYYEMPKWLMLTERRLYFSMYYFPYKFNVLNSMLLHKINEFKIIYDRWPRDKSYIEINNKKVMSVRFKNKKEGQYLSLLVNIILKHVESATDLNETTEHNDEERLENGALFRIAEEYFDDVNPGGQKWGFDYFYYGRFIPEKELEKARQTYANYDIEKEKPIIYYDNSWIGPLGTIEISGVVITNKYLYFKLYKSFGNKKFSTGKVPLTKIWKFQIKRKIFSWMILNSDQKKFILNRFNSSDKRNVIVLEGLMQRFIAALRRQ